MAVMAGRAYRDPPSMGRRLSAPSRLDRTPAEARADRPRTDRPHPAARLPVARPAPRRPAPPDLRRPLLGR